LLKHTIYVVEQFNHRISKWNYTPGSFTFTLDAGQITSITVTDGGTGYNVGDPVNIGPPTLDIANPVQAVAEVGAETGNVIDSILITEAGNGYDPNNLPTVTATTGGSGAILEAVVSTPWGNNGDGTTGEGAPVSSTTDNALYRPTGITLDTVSNPDLLYVTDTFHNRVRIINPSTGAFIDSVGQGGFGDTDFYRPAGIQFDTSAGVVIADELNHRAVRYTIGGNTLAFASVLPDPTPLAFNRPHGVIHDSALDFQNVSDSQRGLISQYNLVGVFQDQYGTPGSTFNNTNLFFPGSGVGVLGGTATTVFGDTRNNAIKLVNDVDITVTIGGNTAGTGVGALYYPESVTAFVDTANYVLAANTLNNRVEVYSSSGTTLTSVTNFGSP